MTMRPTTGSAPAPSRSRVFAKWLAASVLAFLAAAPAARADVRLPALFGHNMALQQNMPVPIWGTAEPGEKVTVSFAGETAGAEADAQGRWKAVLPALRAGAAPGDLTVAGRNTIILTNVVAGEVWLCSGQSNMASKGAYVADSAVEIAAADYPSIRLFTVSLRNNTNSPAEIAGAWTTCTPRSMTYFSAVGYFFGRELHRALQVPVGLINSSRGGTLAEGWTRLARLEADPELRVVVENHEKRKSDVEGDKRKFDEAIVKWEQRAKDRKPGLPVPSRPTWVDPADAPGRPGNLWSTMIEPLIPFAIRGVAWYQGESNASRPDRYARLFPALIADWRAQWGQGDLPFLFVQLPRLHPRAAQPSDHVWARLREAQFKTLNTVTNTGMAVTIDLGREDVEPQIHPTEKKEVGERLAAWALHDVYGKKEVVPSGPLFDRMLVESNCVRIAFTQLGGGLTNKAPAGIRGFALAGEDRRFAWADARIDGDTVVVSSTNVPRPVAVRYGWAGNPETSLFNRAGLPASPFRSDDWPLSLPEKRTTP